MKYFFINKTVSMEEVFAIVEIKAWA